MAGAAVERTESAIGYGEVLVTSRGLAYWLQATLDRERIDDDAYAWLVAHPRFEDACRFAAKAAVDRHMQDRALARVLKDMRRLFLAALVLYLDARGAVTLVSVREFCADLGLVSANSAAMLLLQLRALGFISRGPLMGDGRTRRYLPNPQMKAAFTEMFQTEMTAFALIEPEAEAAANAIADPEIFQQMILRVGAGLVRIAKSSTPSPLTPFAERTSGFAVLMEIALSGAPGDVYPPQGPVHISVRKIAQKCGLSRSHVMRLLREAEKLGYLTRDANETTGLLHAPLRDALRYWHASSMVSSAVFAHYAVQQTEKLDEIA